MRTKKRWSYHKGVAREAATVSSFMERKCVVKMILWALSGGTFAVKVVQQEIKRELLVSDEFFKYCVLSYVLSRSTSLDNDSIF